MNIIIDYTDETKDIIIKKQEFQGLKLVEDQRHFDGNHLVFEKPDRDLAIEIDKMKSRLVIIERITDATYL